MLEQVGYISHCPSCDFRETHAGIAVHIASECPRCSSETQLAGPLWLGKLHETDFCGDILKELEKTESGTKEQAKKIIELCRDELDIPVFYEQHLLCKRLGVSASGINELIDALRSRGFAASRTHFSGTSFKTDAKLDEIESIISMLR
jgi:tRNA (guanine26-N2/guanine27-N2)-dimethyltransferase